MAERLSKEDVKPGLTLRDVRGVRWRVARNGRDLHEIDEAGKRLKPSTYETFANLDHFRGPLVAERMSKEPGDE